MIRRKLIATALMCALTTAWAHGPSRQKVVESVAIAAPPEAVWSRIQDFGALQSWHPAVESSENTDGNQVGSVRTLHLKGGATVVEELTAYSAEEHRLAYKMKDPGPVPVNNYTSMIKVNADVGGSVVEWRGAFYRGDPNNNPAPERNDEAAIAAVTGIYQAGLANLKKMVEGK